MRYLRNNDMAILFHCCYCCHTAAMSTYEEQDYEVIYTSSKVSAILLLDVHKRKCKMLLSFPTYEGVLATCETKQENKRQI